MSVRLLSGNDRLHPRTRRIGYLMWRFPGTDAQQTGWLLDSSRGGTAFAWRGETAPPRDAVIETREEGDLARKPWRPSIVRHSRNVHDDLCIVGVEHIDSGVRIGS